MTTLDILKTDGRLRPVGPKSGSSSRSTRSEGPASRGMTEEMKTRTRSSPCGSAETTTAGRTFAEVRSVKGKGTSTTSPRAKDGVLDRFPVVQRVDVLRRFGEEIERAPRQSHLRDALDGNVVVQDDDGDLSLRR